MTELIIPKGAQWYLDKIMTCAPDNTIIYGAKKDIVIIYPIQTDKPANIKYIYAAHKEQITAVAVCSNWGQPNKLAVTIGEDNIVRLWDIEDRTFKTSHNAHSNGPGIGIGITFINSTVTSITENCHMVVWCIRSNTARILNLCGKAFNFRVTCLSTCPHNCDLSAFGTNKGLVFIVNTKGTGNILYKLRGHDFEVLSLSWCPSPYNVFYKKNRLSLKSKSEECSNINILLQSDETVPKVNENISLPNKYFEEECNISNFENFNNKTIKDDNRHVEIENVHVNDLVFPEKTIKKVKKPVDKKNPWGNLEFSDDEENNSLNISTSTNFLSECKDVEKLILDAYKEVEKAQFDMNSLKETLDDISKNHIQNDVKMTDDVTDKEQNIKSVVNEIDIKENSESGMKPNSGLSNEAEKVNERDLVVDKECDSIPSKSTGGSILDPEDVDSVSDLDYGFDGRARSYEELSDVSKLQCTVEDIIEKAKFRESKLSTSISSSLNVEVDDTSVVEDDNMKIENSSFSLDTENIQKLEIKGDEGENIADFNFNTNRNRKLQRDLTGTSETLPSDDENDSHPLLGLKYCSTSISSSLHVEVDELSIASDGNVKTEEMDSLKSFNITADCSESKEEQSANSTFNDDNILKDMLLVSSCRKGNLCIWRAGGDGRLQTSLKLNPKQNKYRRGNTDLSWITVCWMRPNLILMSSPNGELLAWNISSNENTNETNSKPYRLIHSEHHRSIYCIAAPCSSDDQTNTPLCAWTLGQDRFLYCVDLGVKHQVMATFPLFWGFVYCIAACPLNPFRVAIGVGDQSLRLFDLSCPYTINISMKVIFQNIKGKVLAVAWHPIKENCLAFSTNEGRVEIFDPGNPSKNPILLHSWHKKGVYSLCWGPSSSDPNKWVLYTCSEGHCVMYDDKKPNADPVKLKISNKTDGKISEIAWNLKYKAVAVGFKDGSIMLAKPNFEPIIHFYDHKKSIQHLCWHPICTISDDQESKYKNWLATASSDSAVIVYDCEIDTADDMRDRKVAVLNGHTMNVCKLTWSPHQGGQLVSVSLDGTAMVWDVPSQTLLSTFMGHNGDGILSVLWSPLNSDLILTGGRDCTLCIWNKSNYPPILEKPNSQKLHTKSSTKIVFPNGTMSKANIKSKVDSEDEEEEDNQNPVKTDNSKTKLAKGLILPMVSKQQNLQGDACVDACRRLLNKVDEKVKAREIEESETCAGAESTPVETENPTNNSVDHLKLFGNLEDIRSLLNLEQKGHERYGRWELHNNISLWKNDIIPMIEDAINRKILTDWHLNLSVILGKRFWKETLLVYVEQLIEQNEIVKAVSYLLLCHNVSQALQVLCKAKLYREALAIARCRLASDDPDIDMILKKWAVDAEFMGSYQIAAECYISLENFEEAAKIFSKKTDINSQRLALDLAKRTSNKDLINMLERRLEAVTETDSGISDKNAIDDSLE